MAAIPVPTTCILGARGFIGSHVLASDVMTRGRLCHVLSRQPGSNLIRATGERVRHFSGDLSRPHIDDGFVVADATVVNLVYLAGDNIAKNCAAVDLLVDRCLSAGARRLIHVSTAVVAGATRASSVDEDTTCLPVTPYEACKLAIEDHLRNSCRHRLDFAVIRPTAVFGDGGRNLASTVQFVINAHRWQKTLRMSFFETRRMNLVSVENVVAAINFVLNIERPLSGDCFIVSDDHAPENTFGGACRLIHRSLGIPVPPMVTVPFRDVVQRVMLRVLRGQSIVPYRRYKGRRLELEGFRPPYSFREMVLQYADRYRRRMDPKS